MMIMIYIDFFYKEDFDVKITSGQGGTLNGIEHCNVRSHCPMQRRRLLSKEICVWSDTRGFVGIITKFREEAKKGANCKRHTKHERGEKKTSRPRIVERFLLNWSKVLAQNTIFKVSFEAKNLPQAVAVAVYIFRRCIVLNQFNWRTMIQPTSSVRIHQSSSTQIKILTSDIIEQKDEKCALKGFLVFDELPPGAWHLFEYFWLKITDHQTTFMTETPERQI